MSITVKDIAWASGFLEGEGSFIVVNGKNKPVRCIATQKQREPIDRLHRFFGGRVYAYEGRSPLSKSVMWRWVACESLAAQVAMTVCCLMSPDRQAQIKRMLDAWKSKKARPNMVGRSSYPKVRTNAI